MMVARTAILTGLLLAPLGQGSLAPTLARAEEKKPVAATPISGPLLNPIIPRLNPHVGKKTKGIQAAIDRGLAWLAAHQGKNGGWGVRSHAAWCHGKRLPAAKQETAVGYQGFMAATTALAVNAFLEAGYLPRGRHPYAAHLRKGLAYLMSVQSEDGGVGVPEAGERTGKSPRWVYSHAFGSLALVRAYGLTGNELFRQAAQDALDFTALARNPHFGWRYGIKPGDNDTSVTACMLLAMNAARSMSRRAEALGGTSPLTWNLGAFEGGMAWVKKINNGMSGGAGYVERNDHGIRYTALNAEGFSLSAGGSCSAMAAMILYWGGEDFPESGDFRRAASAVTRADYLSEAPGGLDAWFLWFAAQVTERMTATYSKERGDSRRWRRGAAARVVNAQNREGDICRVLGSWNPDGRWGKGGGRVYSTSLMVMSLLRLGYEDTGGSGQAAIFRDRKQPLEARVHALEVVPGPLSKDALTGVKLALRDKRPLLRLAAAQTIARLRPKSGSLRKILEGRVEAEEDTQVKAALLWALYRSAGGTESSKACLQALVLGPTPDPGLAFILSYVREAVAGTLSPERRARYDGLPSADQVLWRADRLGELQTGKRALRASRVLWRLLDELDLPTRLDTSLDGRRPLLHSRFLEGPGIVEALEDLLSLRVWKEGGKLKETKQLYQVVLAGADTAPVVERAFLRAVLALHLAESIHWAQTNVILGGVGMSMGSLQVYGFETVDAAIAELKQLRTTAGDEDAESVKRLAAFLAAFSVLKRFDVMDTITTEGLLAMVRSPQDIAPAIAELEGTSAVRFLRLAGARVMLSVYRMMARMKAKGTGRMLVAGALTAEYLAAREAESVDGRRVTVRALELYAQAGLITAVGGPHQMRFVPDIAEERKRLPGLGRTPTEVELLLTWSELQKALGKSAEAKSLAQEARERAAALGESEMVERADLLLK